MTEQRCTECGDESLRFCVTCQLYFCGGCACVHIPLLTESLAEGTFVERADAQIVEARFAVPAYEGYEQSSGQSWLSNAVIIGSLPDNKLRDALARYRSIVRLIEAEMAARALAPKRRMPAHVKGPTQVRSPRSRVRPRRSAERAVADAIAQLGLDFVRKYAVKGE